MQVGLFCEFSKLVRMGCVILSFQIGYNLVGVSNGLSIRVKKSAFSNWSCDRFFLEVTIRVLGVVRFIKVTFTIAHSACVSWIRSCFSQVSVLVNRNRAGIAHISTSHLQLLCFGMLVFQSMKLSVKIINPTPGPFKRLAFIGGC